MNAEIFTSLLAALLLYRLCSPLVDRLAVWLWGSATHSNMTHSGSSASDGIVSPEDAAPKRKSGSPSLPGVAEVVLYVCAFALGLLYVPGQNPFYGVLLGTALALSVNSIFAVVVVGLNRLLIRRERRAPTLKCIVTPITTALTLISCWGWPSETRA